MKFESAAPSVVRSIKQRDLLNLWLRLFARQDHQPRIAEYQPDRIGDELPKLALFTVDRQPSRPQLFFERESTHMAEVYGHASTGQSLDEYLGPELAPMIVPAYVECISRARPIYTIFMVQDVLQRPVSYERLLLPFFQDGLVTQIVASHHNISADGAFETSELMGTGRAIPKLELCAVIDRHLERHSPTMGSKDDIVEI